MDVNMRMDIMDMGIICVHVHICFSVSFHVFVCVYFHTLCEFYRGFSIDNVRDVEMDMDSWHGNYIDIDSDTDTDTDMQDSDTNTEMIMDMTFWADII